MATSERVAPRERAHLSARLRRVCRRHFRDVNGRPLKLISPSLCQRSFLATPRAPFVCQESRIGTPEQRPASWTGRSMAGRPPLSWRCATRAPHLYLSEPTVGRANNIDAAQQVSSLRRPVRSLARLYSFDHRRPGARANLPKTSVTCPHPQVDRGTSAGAIR